MRNLHDIKPRPTWDLAGLHLEDYQIRFMREFARQTNLGADYQRYVWGNARVLGPDDEVTRLHGDEAAIVAALRRRTRNLLYAGLPADQYALTIRREDLDVLRRSRRLYRFVDEAQVDFFEGVRLMPVDR